MILEQEALLSYIQLFCTIALAVAIISMILRSQVGIVLNKLEKNNRLLRENKSKLNDLAARISALTKQSEMTHSKSQQGAANDSIEASNDSEEDGISPDTKLYIGNIDYSVTEDELVELFDRFGAIEMVNIPVHRHSGKTRGFGFVTFSEVRSASEALKMNGEDFKGRSLQVNYAKSRG